MRKHWLAAAAAVMTLVGAAHAQSSNTVDAQALQRAQVQADQELWHKAGMSFLPSPAAYPEVKESSEYRKYEQLRNGPAFQEAVVRHMGQSQTVAEHGTPVAQP